MEPKQSHLHSLRRQWTPPWLHESMDWFRRQFKIMNTCFICCNNPRQERLSLSFKMCQQLRINGSSIGFCVTAGPQGTHFTWTFKYPRSWVMLTIFLTGRLSVSCRAVIHWSLLTLSVCAEYIYSAASQATSPAPFKYLFNKYPYWIF
jgi:hypothetical protein